MHVLPSRHRMLSGLLLAAMLLLCLAPLPALAWPLEAEWNALTRNGGSFSDPAGDAAGSRDIVGSGTSIAGVCAAASCPSAYLFNDGTYLHFRIRLDSDPRQGGGLAPFGWGLLIDTNGVPTDYEWMIMVNGINNPDLIEIDRNVVQGSVDSPSDSAEVVAWSENAVENADYRVTAADSTFSGDADYFLDFRLPYTTFKAVTGITDATPVRLYVGSSNNAQTLSSDLGDPLLSLGLGDTVLPTGTEPSTGSVLFVSGLTGTGDETQAYQGQVLFLKVTDQDENTSGATVQSVTVTVTSPAGDSVNVTLTETGVNTGTFTAALPTAGGAPDTTDGTLQVTPVETVTAAYLDAIDAALAANGLRTDTLTVLPSADLAVAKTVSNTTPAEESSVAFTLTVTNNGPNAAAGIQVTDLLPAGLAYISHTGAGAYNTATGVWEVPSLASGATTTLVVSAAVQAGTGGTTIINTAAITASSLPDTVSGNNTAIRPITVGGADLEVSKTVSNETPATGSTVIYAVSLRNNGANNATGVQVTDLLPAGLSYASHTATQGSYGAASGVWDVGSLATGSTTTLSVTATVTAASGSTVTNTAAITAADQADGNTANNTASTAIFVAGADIALSKTVSNASPNEGSAVSFQVAVSNNGPGSPTGVEVTDLLPAGLTFSSALASQGTYSAATGVWTIGTLATSATLTINATVDAGTNGRTITNTAAVTASGVGDPVPANNSAGAALTVQRADVAITKTVSNSSPNLGEAISYTVAARNNGPNDATNLQVTDVLPALVAYASHAVSPAGSTYNAATGLWNIGTLASGATTTLQINVTVSGNNNDALKTAANTAATSGADQADPVPANNAATASFTIQGCDLAVAKTVNDTAPSPGGTVTYTVTLRNNGPFPSDRNVVVYDVLPPGLTYLSDTTSAGNYNTASGAWNFGNTTIASGVTHTLTLTAAVTGPTGSIITNAASNAAPYDIDLGNNLATTPIYVGGTDVAISKTVSDAAPNAGDAVTFTVAVRNNGPNDATSLTVLEALASGFTYSFSSATAGTYSSATGQWTIPTLSSGATATLTVTVTVDSGTGGTTINNTAALAAMAEPDMNPSNNNAAAPLTVRAADIAVTKTADTLTPVELDPVVYTITVTNNGPHDATGVVIQDILSSGLTYSGHVASQGTYSAASGLWSVGAVAKSETRTLEITVRPNLLTGGTNIANTAGISAAGQEDPAPVNDSAGITITPSTRPAPNILTLKSVAVISDPVNAAPPYRTIPGAVMEYLVTASNLGTGNADAGSVVLEDAIPANTAMFVGDLPATTGPVLFADGALVSGLTYTFGGLGDGSDSIEFSDTAGGPPYVYGYVPTPDAEGFDGNVTSIRIRLNGAFEHSGAAPYPSFTVRFQVRVR